MNWSNAALKLTIGVGSIGATAIVSDALVERVGLYSMIAIILVPFALLVFFKIGELADWIESVTRSDRRCLRTGLPDSDVVQRSAGERVRGGPGPGLRARLCVGSVEWNE